MYKATRRNSPPTDQSVDYSSCRLCKKQGLPFLDFLFLFRSAASSYVWILLFLFVSAASSYMSFSEFAYAPPPPRPYSRPNVCSFRSSACLADWRGAVAPKWLRGGQERMWFNREVSNFGKPKLNHPGHNQLATSRHEGCAGCCKRGSSMLAVGKIFPPQCFKLNIEEPSSPQPADRVAS